MPEILIKEAPSAQPSAAKIAASEIIQTLTAVARACVDGHQSAFTKLWQNPEATPAEILAEIGPRGVEVFERGGDLVGFILGQHTGRPLAKMEAEEYAPPLPYTAHEDGTVTLD